MHQSHKLSVVVLAALSIVILLGVVAWHGPRRPIVNTGRPVKGDLNGDGRVDIRDLSIVLSHYGQHN